LSTQASIEGIDLLLLRLNIEPNCFQFFVEALLKPLLWLVSWLRQIYLDVAVTLASTSSYARSWKD
jgi:hypothetical protein